ncbi:MAG: glycosyltransferase family 2 protein [bacterium]|nr:glycosyltransferase family 2 protein [bacterium]
MLVSIIVPVFNEEKTIATVLHELSVLRIPETEFEIIVVNDGSSDATQSEINSVKSKIKRLKVIEHKENMGKGAAIQTALKSAKGEYVLIQDADLEYNPSDISVLLKPIVTKQAEVVFGTRLRRFPNFSRDERTPTFFLHYLGNRLLSFATSVLYGQWVTDMETGYKLLPRPFLTKIRLNAKSFDFEPEITAKILKRGYRICEIPITTNPRDHTAGKKLVASKDGPVALLTLLKYRFTD